MILMLLMILINFYPAFNLYFIVSRDLSLSMTKNPANRSLLGFRAAGEVKEKADYHVY